jgi:DNA-binding transcriptional regulator LsrR (DeoR family)
VTIAALWKKEQIDLAELARLRWVEKWKYERLAAHFGVGRTKIKEMTRLAGSGKIRDL